MLREFARAGLVCAAAVGCSDEPVTPPVDGIEPRGGWMFQSLIDAPDGRTAYLTWIQDLAAVDAVLGNERALEVAGNGRVYTHGGRAWAGAGDTPTITPLRLEAGAITPVEELAVSLAGFGFAQSPFGHVFVSEDEAYLFGDSAVVWDPLANELVDELSLEPARVGGRLPDAGVGVVRGGLAFVPVTYEVFPNVDDAVHVLVLDTDARSVRGVLSDDRCKSAGSVSLLADGTLWVTGTHAYLLPEFGQVGAPVTCLLRIPPDADGFDPTFVRYFQDITGHDATGFVPLDERRAVAFVFDEAVVPAAAVDDPKLYFTSPSSRWWVLDVEAGTGAPVEGLPWVPSGSGIASSLGDGRVALALPEAFPAVANRLVVFDGEVALPLFEHSGRGVLSPL
jgi:hypothetical protein